MALRVLSRINFLKAMIWKYRIKYSIQRSVLVFLVSSVRSHLLDFGDMPLQLLSLYLVNIWEIRFTFPEDNMLDHSVVSNVFLLSMIISSSSVYTCLYVFHVHHGGKGVTIIFRCLIVVVFYIRLSQNNNSLSCHQKFLKHADRFQDSVYFWLWNS